MKNYVFSLQKIREYKKQILNREKNTLLGLRMEKSGLEEQKERLYDDLRAITDRHNADMAKGASVMQLKLFQFSRESIAREQSEIDKQMLFLDTYIERQRKVVMKLSQELTSYDKLEEKQYSEYMQKSAKEAETLIEEFVSFKSATQEG